MTIATNLRTLGSRVDLPAPSIDFDLALPSDTQQKLASVSQSPLTPVLIVAPGESRRTAARTLHRLSHPNDERAPFVEIDCTLFAEDSLGAQLFGPEHEAFTSRERSGQAELARGGTLLLDNLTALPAGAQARLVRFIDAVTRKASGPRQTDELLELRVVAACERDPLGAIEAGR